jgi:hypothetical protein
MSWETIYYISQSIAVILIIGSLTAVWRQVRENTRQARLANMTGFLDSINEAFLPVYNNQQNFHIFNTGMNTPDQLNEEELAMFFMIMMRVTFAYFSGVEMANRGLLDDDYLTFTSAGIATYTDTPGGQIYYQRNKHMFPARAVELLGLED